MSGSGLTMSGSVPDNVRFCVRQCPVSVPAVSEVGVGSHKIRSPLRQNAKVHFLAPWPTVSDCGPDNVRFCVPFCVRQCQILCSTMSGPVSAQTHGLVPHGLYGSEISFWRDSRLLSLSGSLCTLIFPATWSFSHFVGFGVSDIFYFGVSDFPGLEMVGFLCGNLLRNYVWLLCWRVGHFSALSRFPVPFVRGSGCPAILVVGSRVPPLGSLPPSAPR